MTTPIPAPAPVPAPEPRRGWSAWKLGGLMLLTALATGGVLALLTNIFQRKQEARQPFMRVVEVNENTVDPAVWGRNWPSEYDSYRRTVDSQRTRYGGSDAVPRQLLDAEPWLRDMFSGYAFSLDYREARGHAYMLADQEHTERVLKRPQTGACLHCHASVLPLYRHLGGGDSPAQVMAGFQKACAMPFQEARHLKDEHGHVLVSHPVTCLDCHDPATMQLRVTRPGLINGLKALKAHQGDKDYDVNRDASRQEMRSFVCAQCHVEYYFKGPEKVVTFPWANGVKVEEIEAYYDKEKFSDWKHGITGAPVLKAQHPEFEMWNQGTHARAGVACADCHMPYKREGALKVSDHQVRSPLLNIAHACQTCHRVPEAELKNRAETIQDRTKALIERSASALQDMMKAVAEAKAAGATEAQLQAAYGAHRKAQWRLDFVCAENSRGFHAAQESARILAESIDLSRQGQLEALKLRANPPAPPSVPPAPPVGGVTEKEKSPPGPLNPPAGTVPDKKGPNDAPEPKE